MTADSGSLHDEETDRETAATDPTTDDESVLSVRNLEKRYGRGDDAVEAVTDLTFDVEPGTVVGLLGPNGAGKTTTIKMLLGLIIPTAGSVEVAGIDVHENLSQGYNSISAVLEGARNVYWRLTVKQNVRFFASLSGIDPNDRASYHTELLDLFDLTEKADTAVRELSRGQKQKVSLACTFARETDVVVLDEPTLGLDVESGLNLRQELNRIVDEYGTTVILSSHDMDVIEDLCDRVIIMEDGEIVADDSVSNLLGVFNQQCYEITVDGDLQEATRRRLRTEYEVEEFDGQYESTRFRARVADDGIYNLMQSLQSAGVTVDTIETVRPDLEEVFLEVTNARHATRPAEVPTR
ncbi:ATP-binding cassette domain-containing protein [Halomicrobium sp. ZPS1]|nr:ATP-binding cassette domain-containing protein [Halomicrobium mukohataei]QFR21904.1 ATP-binding cassette domain-containing protein [Halomicrobium sp. ZPS1]